MYQLLTIGLILKIITESSSIILDLEDTRIRLLRIPGTKWCGPGSVARHEHDYGKHMNTDKCCQNHDLCWDIIMGHETKYNLTNPSFYSRLNCECDEEFRNCLKTVGTAASKRVGRIYFTGLKTKCFKNEFPIVKCLRRSYFPRKKCIKYKFDTTKEKKYQWFDVANF